MHDMDRHCKHVVLCKGASGERQDAYMKAFESAGYQCAYLCTMYFQFVNLPQLRDRLLRAHQYYGLILTSSRAAEAIGQLLKEEQNLLEDWTELPAYCVGAATESAARSIGLRNCLGKESGNSMELAKKIIADVTTVSKPFLYLCSEIASETVDQLLNSHGISMERLVVYRPEVSKSLESDFLTITDSSPRIFVFFSSFTVENVAPLIRKFRNNVKDDKMVAIGPVTKQTLINIGLTVYATAEKPDPVALLESIRKAEDTDKTNATV